MRIEEYLFDPVQAYLKCERYINNGSPSGFSMNTTRAETCPRSLNKVFALKKVRFMGNVVVKGFNITDKTLTMLIHPDMTENKYIKEHCCTIEDDVIVSPTASGRTVFDLKNKRFIKLAYLNYLGRILRHMESDKILSAYEATQQLIKVANSGMANPCFSFLKEDKGIVAYMPFDKQKVSTSDKIPESCLRSGMYEWGVLFREAKPYPYIEEEEYLIPFFSLFSDEFMPDRNCINAEHELLIYQLFKKQSKQMEQFLLEDILYPLFNTYFDALILGGIELEAHAQNLLLSITKDFKVKRIVCRDLESAGRDIDLMKFLNIQYNTVVTNYKYNTRTPKLPNQKYDKYTTSHSFMFDFKLGEYVVTPLLNCVKEKYEKIDIEEISNKIRVFNQQFIRKLPKDFFPEEWCDYEAVNYEQTGRERIYRWHANPKYR